MKKFISILLALVMSLALCACGGTAAPAQETNAEAASVAAEAEPAVEAAEENTAEAADWQSIYDEASALYYVDYDYPAAFEKLQGAEESENASALYLLGLCYYNGFGTAKDTAKGAELLAKAADLGSVEAKYSLADAYRTGIGVEADSEKADELYKAFLTEAENVEPTDTPEYGRMLYYIANCYAYGRGTEVDAESAGKYAKMALDSGNAGVLNTYGIGVMYENKKLGVENTDEAQAIYADVFPQIEELANRGVSLAERVYAQYYQYGDGGVEQDYAKALEWYEKAAEQGNSASMYSIGRMYRNGWGVEQNDAKAVEWHEKAAELGNEYAMNDLGVMYCNGDGVEQDYTKALEWFEKAAERGNADAMFNAGWMYDNGQGVEQDYDKARELYEKAAELGNAGAMNNLGWMYHNGHGVEQDYAKAMEWYEKAAELGNEKAVENIANLREQGLVA